MLHYLKHDDINYAQWDDCIKKAPNAMIYAFSWYLDIVSPGWHAIVKEEGNAYIAVMPIPVAQKFGMLYVKHPVFCQQLGLFHTKPISKDEWREISQLLKSKTRLISRYGLNTGNEEVLEEGFSGFDNNIYTTYHLDLNQNYKKIFSGYRKDRKWRVNKAKRSGLEIRLTEDIDRFLSIFHEYVTPKIAGVIGEKYEYRILRQLYKATKERGMGFMYEAVNEHHQVQAMALFFLFNKKLIFMLNCSTPEGKKNGAVSFIIDYVLQENAQKDLIFDFDAPEVEHLVDFYSSFGPVKAHFLSIKLNDLPAPVKWMKQTRMRFYRLFLKKRTSIE